MYKMEVHAQARTGSRDFNWQGINYIHYSEQAPSLPTYLPNCLGLASCDLWERETGGLIQIISCLETDLEAVVAAAAASAAVALQVSW